MGLNQITNLAVKYSDDFINACSKSKGFISKTFQKSASIFPEKIDQSVSPVFLESLRNVEGKDAIDKITKIKDLIMKAMGFKHPQNLEIVKDNLLQLDDITASFLPPRAIILVPDNTLNAPVERIIGTLIHELDHLLKFTKLYKAIGKDKFKEAEKIHIVNKFFKGIPYNLDKNVYSSIKINDDFYKKMIDDVDITDFEVEKYLEAFTKMKSAKVTSDLEPFEYFTNLFEVTAFKKESLAYKNLGVNYITAADLFPKNYLKIIKNLEVQGIKNPDERVEVFELVRLFVFGEAIGDKKYFKILQKFLQDDDITDVEYNYLKNVLCNLTQDKCQIIASRIEKIISDGEFSRKDILRKIDRIISS